MSQNFRRVLTTLVCAVTVLPLTAVSAQARDSGVLDWAPCPVSNGESEMECASLRVPVDWDEPGQRELTLEIGRLKATGQSEGSVLVAYGGPFGGYIEATPELAGQSFARLRQRMDIITWDLRGGPNGPGLSTPTLDCDLKLQRIPPYPRDQAEFDQLAASNRATAQACRNTDPVLFDHMSSADHAKDMDAIRRALGQSQLNFYGSSYGGYFGQAYARLFPERVRTMVLDGSPNHSTNNWQRELEALATDYERMMRRFVDWCATDASCALHDTDVQRRWLRLVDRADRAPIAAPELDAEFDGRDLRSHALSAVRAGTPERWRELAEAIARAERGDASAFTEPDGSPYPSAAVPAVVECLDLPAPASQPELASSLRRLDQVAPNLGSAVPRVMNPLSCIGWPTQDMNLPGPLPKGLPPLLGAGYWNEFPSTRRTIEQVPGSGSIQHDGFGHVLYFSNGCARAHIDRYLTDRVVPPRGTKCQGSA